MADYPAFPSLIAAAGTPPPGGVAAGPARYPAFPGLVAAMVAGRSGPGGKPFPGTDDPGELPDDLAAALVARFAASDLAAEGLALYRDKAGEKVPRAYLVFSIVSGGPIYTADTCYWFDQRVRMTAYAATAVAANALRDRSWRAFGELPYHFATGSSMPLFRRNTIEGLDPLRTVGEGYLNKATWEASARTLRKEAP